MAGSGGSGSVQSIVEAVRARLSTIDGEWRRLDTERRGLIATLEMYHATAEGDSEDRDLPPKMTSVQSLPVAEFSKMGITEGVREFVRLYPGSSSAEIMDALEPLVQSKTSGPALRKLISWTLTDMVNNRKQLTRDDQGRFYLRRS